MPMELGPIKTKRGITSVLQDDDGRVYWTSGADIDADGANGQNGKPFAYRPDGNGLDSNLNAGWPDGWNDVLIDNGKGAPMDDGNGNWYSKTTYEWADRPIATRFVDAASIPYVVVNPTVRARAKGIVMGCKARLTFRNKCVDAVVADESSADKIGEISIRAAEMIGIGSSPIDGGTDQFILFEFWPGTPATIDGEIYELIPY